MLESTQLTHERRPKEGVRGLKATEIPIAVSRQFIRIIVSPLVAAHTFGARQRRFKRRRGQVRVMRRVPGI